MLKDTLINIIGSYVSNDTSVTGLGTLDIPWIFASLLFIALVVTTAWFACRILIGILHE